MFHWFREINLLIYFTNWSPEDSHYNSKLQELNFITFLWSLSHFPAGPPAGHIPIIAPYLHQMSE